MSATTQNLGTWNSDDNYVAQAMESCMYASAHADDTLVLIGPARKPDSGGFENLTAVGVLQNFSVQQGRSIVPQQAIGSARTFFQSSKTSVSGSIGRLFVNGKNLHRALYDNFYNADGSYKLDGQLNNNTDLLPHARNNTNYLANLDSRMFLVPFGMAVVFRDKLQNEIGAIYIEMCVIPNWNANISAGSPTLVEGTSFLADRVRAINTGKVDAIAANTNLNTQLAGEDGDLVNRLNSIVNGGPGTNPN